MRAVNLVGASDYSETLMIVAATIPDAPGIPWKHVASINSIELRWDEPVSDGGSSLTDYRVYWDEGRGTDEFVYIANTLGYQTFTINAEKSSYFIGGEWYIFRVAAVNIIGQGDYTES